MSEGIIYQLTTILSLICISAICMFWFALGIAILFRINIDAYSAFQTTVGFGLIALTTGWFSLLSKPKEASSE